jgi:non-specific serine/threonine protein kinase
MSALNADQIEARLDDRFSLLARGNRAARRHHQTLMAVFDWSYRLLDDAERRLFDRLSIFAGAFDLEAVDAVCIDHPGEDAADLMVRLVDKSLVYLTPAHSPTPRYLLLETLREYGWEHLQNTEQAAEMRRAHAAYYRSLAETAAAAFRGKDEASWLHRLVLDNGNLRAALGWTVGAGEPEAAVQFAGSLHHFWDMQGQYREGRLWLKQALELSSPANSTAHGWAWYGAGELAMIQGDFAESTHSFEQARDLFTAVGDATGLADSLRYLGFLCIHADERRAENLLTEALANARAAGSNYAEGWALLFLTVLSLARRNFEQARQRSIESERVLLAVGQRESIAWSRLTHGAAEWGLGNLAAAAEPVRDGLDIFAEIPGVWGISLGLLFAGLISRTGKDWPTAIRLLSASETVRESIGAGTQPFLEEWFAETVSEATTAIGTEAFDQHWEAGATAALDECLADARHALRRAKTYTG